MVDMVDLATGEARDLLMPSQKLSPTLWLWILSIRWILLGLDMQRQQCIDFQKRQQTAQRTTVQIIEHFLTAILFWTLCVLVFSKFSFLLMFFYIFCQKIKRLE